MDRRQFNSLLATGAMTYGTTPLALGHSFSKINKMNDNSYEVIIVGGSYAGLAAALALGRSIRKTLVIDSGKPCNRQTPHSHNFITQDGVAPQQIAQIAQQQILKYPTVSFANDLVTEVKGSNGDFQIVTAKSEKYHAKKLIFATGIKDIMPNIPGFAAAWGTTAIHCPYCHGYEVKAQRTGILVNNDSALDFAKLILNWTDQLTIFTNGKPLFDVQAVNDIGLEVVTKRLKAIDQEDGKIKQLRFADDSNFALTVLYHRPKYEQHCKIPEQLGCQLTDTGYLAVNEYQQTNVAGVYAVGDATTFFRAVAVASASGTKAAGILNHELISEKWSK